MTVELLTLCGLVLILWFSCVAASAANDFPSVVVATLLLAFFSGVFGAELSENSYKEDCEASLPRDQVCVIVAVPKDIEEK